MLCVNEQTKPLRTYHLANGMLDKVKKVKLIGDFVVVKRIDARGRYKTAQIINISDGLSSDPCQVLCDALMDVERVILPNHEVIPCPRTLWARVVVWYRISLARRP